MPKVNILGVWVDDIDAVGLQERISESIKAKKKEIFAYVNVHAVNIAWQNDRFREFLNCSSIAYCDGEGVRLGAKMLGTRISTRIALTHWVWPLCRWCEQNGHSVFFLGGSLDAVERAVQNVRSACPYLKIVGWQHGFFKKYGAENDRVVEMISEAKPGILFVAFGMPLQELWISENIDSLQANAILPSGSMVEYAARTRRVAPIWMSRNGIEWLYRLCQEPRRLSSRYLLGNLLFLLRVVRQRATHGEK